MRRRVLSTALALLLGLAMTGCDGWTHSGGTIGHARFNRFETTLTAQNVASLDELWSADVLAMTPEPMLNDDRVYLVTGTGTGPTSLQVRALDALSGTPVWSRTLLTHPETAESFSISSPSLADDQLWFGYDARNPTAGWSDFTRIVLDATDGTTLFRSFTVPAPGSDYVDIGTRVSLLDVSAGQHSLYVDDQVVLGSGQWSALLPPGPAGFYGPSAADGQLFVTNGSTVNAFPFGGCVQSPCPPTWTTDLGSALAVPVAAEGGSDVLVTTGTELVSLARDTGAVNWRAPLPAAAAGVALAGDSIYVSHGSTLAVYAASGCGSPTCGTVWTASLDAPATTAPTVAGGVVYVGTAGTVDALPAAGCGAATCEDIAAVSTPGTPSSVVVGEGRLITIGGGKVTVYAPAS